MDRLAGGKSDAQKYAIQEPRTSDENEGRKRYSDLAVIAGRRNGSKARGEDQILCEMSSMNSLVESYLTSPKLPEEQVCLVKMGRRRSLRDKHYRAPSWRSEGWKPDGWESEGSMGKVHKKIQKICDRRYMSDPGTDFVYEQDDSPRDCSGEDMHFVMGAASILRGLPKNGGALSPASVHCTEGGFPAKPSTPNGTTRRAWAPRSDATRFYNAVFHHPSPESSGNGNRAQSLRSTSSFDEHQIISRTTTQETDLLCTSPTLSTISARVDTNLSIMTGNALTIDSAIELSEDESLFGQDPPCELEEPGFPRMPLPPKMKQPSRFIRSQIARPDSN